jgi:hypothetical protein
VSWLLFVIAEPIQVLLLLLLLVVSLAVRNTIPVSYATYHFWCCINNSIHYLLLLLLF